MAAIPVPVAGDPTAQSWAAAVAGKLNGFGWVTYTGATDPSAYMIIPASAFGLVTIVGGLASPAGAGTADASAFVSECYPQSGGGALRVRVCGFTGSTNDIFFNPSLTSYTVNAFAWGVIAGTTRPGDDEGDEGGTLPA